MSLLANNQKIFFRNQIKDKFAEASLNDLLERSNVIVTHIKKLISLLSPSCLVWGGFCPLKDEPQIEDVYQNHLKWAYPKSDLNQNLKFYFKGSAPMVKGLFGVKEPIVDSQYECRYDQLQAVLVPGRAFDKKGNRLGRGGGFYDRVLPKLNAIKIGVGFDFQLIEEVPTESWDYSMDWIVTETQMINIKGT